MKKKLIIISVNLIILILGYIIFEYFFYTNCISTDKRDFKSNLFNYIKSHIIADFDIVYAHKKKYGYFRDTIIENSKLPPILIFGCSFGYGYKLDEKQALAYKLANLTGRSVYNRSISSYGIQDMPYMLETYPLEKEIPNPEYIIFVFIENHIYRLYRPVMGPNEAYYDVHYKQTKDGLELAKPFYFFYRFPIVRYVIHHYMFNKIDFIDFDKKFDYMKLHFERTKEIVHKKFTPPYPKIVILIFHEFEADIYNTKRWKELQDEGFIIVDVKKITNKNMGDDKYRIPNDGHPNEAAWDVITPALANALHLTKE